MVLTIRRDVSYHWASSYVPHLFLVVWIHSKVKSTRSAALDTLISMFRNASDVESSYRSFYCNRERMAYTGTTGPRCVLTAALRDLRDDEIMNHTIYAVTQAATYFRTNYSADAVAQQYDSSLQKRVLWAQLAACRWQVCSGPPPTAPEPVPNASLVIPGGIESMVFVYCQCCEVSS